MKFYFSFDDSLLNCHNIHQEPNKKKKYISSETFIYLNKEKSIRKILFFLEKKLIDVPIICFYPVGKLHSFVSINEIYLDPQNIDTHGMCGL